MPITSSSPGTPARTAAKSRRSLGLLAALAMLIGACASDGRELAEPNDSQTTTTRPPPPTSAPNSEVGQTGLTLTSPAFQPGDLVPVSATCAGDNIFPELAWTNVPANAVELAVTLSDQTNPEEGLLLWLMAGIDPSNTGLQAGTMPVGAFETLNDYGNPGYGSPCLESFSSGRRDLQFRLYVLTQPSGVAPGAPGNEAWATIRAGSVESASILARIDS